MPALKPPACTHARQLLITFNHGFNKPDFKRARADFSLASACRLAWPGRGAAMPAALINESVLTIFSLLFFLPEAKLIPPDSVCFAAFPCVRVSFPNFCLISLLI